MPSASFDSLSLLNSKEVGFNWLTKSNPKGISLKLVLSLLSDATVNAILHLKELCELLPNWIWSLDEVIPSNDWGVCEPVLPAFVPISILFPPPVIL